LFPVKTLVLFVMAYSAGTFCTVKDAGANAIIQNTATSNV
jgi:hypothetical protein